MREVKESPFSCTINKVNTQNKVIDEFINHPYKRIIKLDNLTKTDPDNCENDEDDIVGKYVLNVW